MNCRMLLAFASMMLTACGGAWSTTSAQRALQIGSEVVRQSDESLEPVVEGAVNRCDSENEYREDFVTCLEPYLPIRYGVALGRRSLRVGQAIVDAWRTGENEGAAAWMPIAACVGHALGEIAGAIRELRLDLPELASEIFTWVDTFGALVSGVCPADILQDGDNE